MCARGRLHACCVAGVVMGAGACVHGVRVARVCCCSEGSRSTAPYQSCIRSAGCACVRLSGLLHCMALSHMPQHAHSTQCMHTSQSLAGRSPQPLHHTPSLYPRTCGMEHHVAESVAWAVYKHRVSTCHVDDGPTVNIETKCQHCTFHSAAPLSRPQ